MVNKAPTYNLRELEAIHNADRVVVRVKINGNWREQEFFPNEEESCAHYPVRACLRRVQESLRHSPRFAGICLYVGAEVREQRMIAAMPHDPMLTPDVLKR